MKTLIEWLQIVASNAWVYHLIQYAVGCQVVYGRLRPYLQGAPGRRVLDVGAGTGLSADYVDRQARYLWFDSDPEKLAGFRARGHHGAAVLGDGTQMCIASHSVDDVICVAVAHHIPGEALDQFFTEIARVSNSRLIFLDPVVDSNSMVSNVLWRLDRGSFPRTVDQLRACLSVHFELEELFEFKVLHRYVLVIGRPRKGESRNVENSPVHTL